MATSTSLSLEVGGTAEDEDMISETGQDFHDELHDEAFQIQEDQDMLEEASSQLGYDRTGAQEYSRDDDFMQDTPPIHFSELPENSGNDFNVTDGEAAAVAPAFDDQSELYDWEDEIDYTSLEQPAYPGDAANTSSNPTHNHASIDQSATDTPDQDSVTYGNVPPQSHDLKDTSTEQTDDEVDTPEEYHAPIDSTQTQLHPSNEIGHEDAWLSPVGADSPSAISQQYPDSGIVTNQPTAHEEDEKVLPVAEDREPQDTSLNPNTTEENISHEVTGHDDVAAANDEQYAADDNYGAAQENPYAFDPFFEELSGHHLHPHLVPTIIVNYEHEQFPLFPPLKGYPELEEYEDWGPLLNDTQLAYKPILDLFGEIRHTLGDIQPDYELVLKFPDFDNLEIREVSDSFLLVANFGYLFTGMQNDHRFSPQSASGYDFYSMHVISSIFQRMHRNDGATELRPLFVDLSARAVPRHPGLMLKAFFEAARAGIGFSFNDQSFFEAINDGNNIAGTEQDDSRESEINVNEFNDAGRRQDKEAQVTVEVDHLVSVEPRHEYDNTGLEEDFVEGNLTFEHPDIDASYYPQEIGENNTTGETPVDSEAQTGDFVGSKLEPTIAFEDNAADDLLDVTEDEKADDRQKGVPSVDQDIQSKPDYPFDEANTDNQNTNININLQTYDKADGELFDYHDESASDVVKTTGVADKPEHLEAGDSSLDTISNASSTVHDDSHLDSQSEYSSEDDCVDWLMLEIDFDATLDFINTDVDSFVPIGNVGTKSELATNITEVDESTALATELDEVTATEVTNTMSQAKVQTSTELGIDQDGDGPKSSSILDAQDSTSYLNVGIDQNDENDGPIQTGLGSEDFELTWGEEHEDPTDAPFADKQPFEPSKWTETLAELCELGLIDPSDQFIDPEFDTILEADAVASTDATNAAPPDTATTPNKLKRRHSDVEDNLDDKNEHESEKKRLRKTPEPELDEIV